MLTPRSTDELAMLVRESGRVGRPLAIRGAGTWPLALDRASAGATPVSVGAIAGIVEYVPGDLTLTARAGTTIAHRSTPMRRTLPIDARPGHEQRIL